MTNLNYLKFVLFLSLSSFITMSNAANDIKIKNLQKDEVKSDNTTTTPIKAAPEQTKPELKVLYKTQNLKFFRD